ncbi:macrolide family glycosyltransferase [Tengunoibacter tsumagoiensis]|uniref:Putative UDP-glucosyltransferase YjiC n=1 Tax=Tengunoibacter tsumagoiensis TaxID=2014871 RepID=A0A402A755_9CHLR|nr:macrolide family glycosyltransferase [Tengunoibacter tsumagoiensis]GCE14875.1 putative UDP-glucosyltransferase YjiC [Tengunoibacter tsumagoiensis]
MKKYLFCAPPRYGHVNPTLAIIKTLVAQGAEVVYFCTEMFAGIVQSAGATFRPYLSTNLELATDPTASLESSDPIINECFYVFPQIVELARLEHADCIVYDEICLWGRMLAETLHLPAIKYMTTYARNEHFSYQTYANKFRNMYFPATLVASDVRKGLERFCATYNITPSITYENIFLHAEPLNIVFMPRAFHPLEETFDQERFKFVGPPIRTEDSPTNFPVDKLSNQPVIYASRGTVYNTIAGIIDIFLNAFGHREQQLVVALGPHIDPRVFGPLPENVLLHAQIPQLTVLRHTDIFITHGGMNSTMEALANGVPMVVFPHSGEESATAYRIQELKLGIAIDHNSMTVHTLRTAVETIQNDPEYRLNARRMQHILQQTTAVQDAVQEITAYGQKTVAHT